MLWVSKEFLSWVSNFHIFHALFLSRAMCSYVQIFLIMFFFHMYLWNTNILTFCILVNVQNMGKIPVFFCLSCFWKQNVDDMEKNSPTKKMLLCQISVHPSEADKLRAHVTRDTYSRYQYIYTYSYCSVVETTATLDWYYGDRRHFFESRMLNFVHHTVCRITLNNK